MEMDSLIERLHEYFWYPKDNKLENDYLEEVIEYLKEVKEKDIEFSCHNFLEIPFIGDGKISKRVETIIKISKVSFNEGGDIFTRSQINLYVKDISINGNDFGFKGGWCTLMELMGIGYLSDLDVYGFNYYSGTEDENPEWVKGLLEIIVS